MLGLSEPKRRKSELPFGKEDVGTRFVVLVIIMMSALATLALGGAQILLDVRGGWISQMRGQVSIEIPAMNADGELRDSASLAALAERMAGTLEIDGVERIEVMNRNEVEALVAPWLGDSAAQDDLPLPALIGVTLRPDAPANAMEHLERLARQVDANSYLDSHQGWVQDLRRFSGVLLGGAGFMTVMVILCAMLCVSGATRSQLAAHKGDIDLLHLMGASDSYIGAQFVRVVSKDVGFAALLGTGGGLLLLLFGRLIAGEMDDMGLSGTGWSAWQWASFGALPLLVSVLCFVSAKRTVLRELEKMP